MKATIEFPCPGQQSFVVVLCCVVLCCVVLCCVVLCCVVLCCVVLCCVVLCCLVLYCIVLYCMIRRCKKQTTNDTGCHWCCCLQVEVCIFIEFIGLDCCRNYLM